MNHTLDSFNRRDFEKTIASVKTVTTTVGQMN